MAEKKARQLNYELLRILAMLMIVCLHYLSKGGLLENPARADFTAADYTAWLVEALCIVAVNVYVLISGYFGVDASNRTELLGAKEVIKRPFRIWRITFFYSMLLGVLSLLLGGQEFDIYRFFTYLFPIVTEHYWFVTSYVILCLLMPFLNAGVMLLKKRGLYALLLGLLVVFSISKSVIPMQLPWDKYGYDAFWFIILYLTGAFLRRYGMPVIKGRGQAFVVYLLCQIAVFFSFVGIRMVFQKTGRLENFIDYGYSYNHILCYIGAIGLFLTFAQQEGKGAVLERFRGSIELFSGATFGVYLLHEHIEVRSRWTAWFFDGSVQSASVGGFLIRMLVIVFIMYLGCSAIEILRAKLVSLVKKKR